MAPIAAAVPTLWKLPEDFLEIFRSDPWRRSSIIRRWRSPGRRLDQSTPAAPSKSAAPPRGRRPAGRPSRRRLVRWLNSNRRLAVALLLCIAAGLTVQQLTPEPADTVPAFAAARDLPAGQSLGAEDLTVLHVPRGLVPAGSFVSADSLQGQQLAVALRKGQLLADSQLVGPGLLAGNPPGSAAVPLRMADPASIQLLSPGQLVDVVITTGNSFDQPAASQLLAAAVPVLWTSGHGSRASPWLATGETEGLLVVAADADQARRLAGASTQGKLFFVLVTAVPG